MVGGGERFDFVNFVVTVPFPADDLTASKSHFSNLAE